MSVSGHAVCDDGGEEAFDGAEDGDGGGCGDDLACEIEREYRGVRGTEPVWDASEPGGDGVDEWPGVLLIEEMCLC